MFKNILIILVVLVAINIASFAVMLKVVKHQYSRPIYVGEQILTIKTGDTLDKIANKVFSQHRDKFWFKKISAIKKCDTEIKTGEFFISHEISIEGLLELISSNNTVDYKITIVEGFQKYQLEGMFGEINNLSGDIPEINHEGEYLPNTYFYKAGDSRESILKRAKNAMDDYLTESWKNRDRSILVETPRDALILASIIEKETAKADEYALVASVFMNRIRDGMKLQADSTAIYGLTHGNRKFNRRLFTGDLAKENKFNTYHIEGLPRTPICNPGKKAIDAVMHPAETNYLFFVANGSGGHAFSETNAEHNKNVKTWRSFKKRNR